MTCFFCKGEMKPDTTIHTVQLKNCVVVIKNVPCHEALIPETFPGASGI